MTPTRLGRPALALAWIASVVPVATVWADEYVSPGRARIKADVSYLAHDDREGRGPGTKGLDAAADYIAATFREAGLKPAPGADGYFQNFELPSGARRIVGEPSLAITARKDGESTIKAEPNADFSPLSLGKSGEWKGLPVVFAGYGITAHDKDLKLDYDDYDGLDAKDKVVLIVRREPQLQKADSPFGGKENTTYATFGHKIENAIKHGAKAILFVNDAASTKDSKDTLLKFNDAGGGGGDIPFVMLSREFADKVMKAAGQPALAEIEGQIDEDLKPRSRALEGVSADGSVVIEQKVTKVKNVIGVLEGAGPLADETVVVGAHYDHLGMGGMGSMSPGTKAIHNGADDNASGTATVMELARRLAKRIDPLPRRVVFMAFSAEELGLIGSQYYVNHPLYPLDKTVAMINFDMVGRLNTKSDLTVFGAASSPGFGELITALSKDEGLNPRLVPGREEEFDQSDHASFYKKDIPVMFLFTGTHPNYHRPSDDTDLINFDGMARIADVGELLLLDLARRPERPPFTKLLPRAIVRSGSAGRTRGVYLGTRPDYGASPSGGGVLLDGVTEGGPADKAGVKGGDIVIKLGDKDVKDLDSYMAAMGAHKPGEVVDIVVRRNDKDVTLKVTLGSSGSGASPKN